MRRPFETVAEMDATLIERWNARVGPTDTVYHLGDFCFKGSKLATRVGARLNGEIHLLQGNHDTENTRKLPRWRISTDLLEVTIDGVALVLCHYPLLEWPGAFRGALHLHGHTHGRIPPTTARADVGVDIWDYAPVALPEIQARMASAPQHDLKAAYAPRG